ncbi:hypothetical protein HanIR_Chr10g0487511 [Helianthus annuus]|nr:hypothetical protein HanIR_Chr10g0487511 [Helianthus annuus]
MCYRLRLEWTSPYTTLSLSPSSLPRVGMPSPLHTFPRVGIGLAAVFAAQQTALPRGKQLCRLHS